MSEPYIEMIENEATYLRGENNKLRAIIDRRNAKLREWRERAGRYDNVAIGTVVGMMVDEILKEDEG